MIPCTLKAGFLGIGIIIALGTLETRPPKSHRETGTLPEDWALLVRFLFYTINKVLTWNLQHFLSSLSSHISTWEGHASLVRDTGHLTEFHNMIIGLFCFLGGFDWHFCNLRVGMGVEVEWYEWNENHFPTSPCLLLTSLSNLSLYLL